MHVLIAPFIGQWGDNANTYGPDCLVACVAMLLEFFGKLGKNTVDSLAQETNLKKGYKGLMPADGVALAESHGLPTAAHKSVTFADIIREIDAGNPVCVLLAYRYIMTRLDIKDDKPGSDGHYVNIVGYSMNEDGTIHHFIVNDPDYWFPYAERGHDTQIAVTQLEKAMAVYGNQAVFVEVSRMPANDQILALTSNMRRELDQIDALIAIPAPPVKPPPPPQPSKKAVVMDDNTHVRSAASLTSSIVINLPARTPLTVADSGVVTVDGAATHHWQLIVDGPAGTVGLYIAAETLSFV